MAIFAPTTARAVDADVDGYGTFNQLDCDDNNPAINPDAQEVVGNDVDDDCDAVDAVNRRLTERQFPSSGWNWSGDVSQTGCTAGPAVCTVTVGDLTGAASIHRAYSLSISRGKIHAVLGVSDYVAASPAECLLTISTQNGGVPLNPTSASWAITGAGLLTTGALTINPAPRVLKDIKFECDHGATVTLDWLILQNTDDIVPPPSEADISWQGVDMPGGGGTTALIRAAEPWSPLAPHLFGASDVAGIAIKDVLAENEWRPLTGTEGHRLGTQAELAIFDLLPSSWGELFAIGGRELSDGSIVGGFYSYDINSDEWSVLATTNPSPDDDDATDVTVGAVGYTSACTDPVTRIEFAGGRLLVEEPHSGGGVYIANHDWEDRGLVYWDDDDAEACVLAEGQLPSDPIASLARVESYPNEIAALLVGIRVQTPDEPALYLCQLPFSATSGSVDLDCDTNAAEVTCAPVEWSTAWGYGLDVRDIEVDALEPEFAYVASGGDDPGLGEECEDGVGGVVAMGITDDGTEAAVTFFIDLTEGLAQLSADVEVTGVSMDPDGDFLFAFLPRSYAIQYEADRIYRIARANLGTTDWEPINEDTGDEVEREVGIDFADGWLSDEAWLADTSSVKPRPYPAQYAPGVGVDATWYRIPRTEEDTCQGYEYLAAIPTNLNAWGVEGLDHVSGCGAEPDWDPALDTTWTFWPEGGSEHTWQATVVHDVAIDGDGNVWSVSPDMAIMQSEAKTSGYDGQVDCLWQGFPAGGAQVEAVEGAVWATLYDQAVGYLGIPQSFAVVRTLAAGGYGSVWEYEGAANVDEGHYAPDADFNDDLASCVDWPVDVDHVAAPFDAHEDEYDGRSFSNDDGAPLPTEPSWGQPWGLAALSVDVAIVGFQSYAYAYDDDADTATSSYDDDSDTAAVDDTKQTGRIAYTVNGGETWAPIPFDGDYTDFLATTETAAADCPDEICLCDEYEFMSHVQSIELLPQTDRSFFNVDDNWRLEFFAISPQPDVSAADSVADHCSIAKIAVEAIADGADAGTEPDIVVDWTWYGIDNDTHFDGCSLDSHTLSGISASAWGDEAFIFGAYTHYQQTTVSPYVQHHRGGVCTIDIDDPLLARTTVVSPNVWQFGIGAVAPHPYVTGMLAVAPVVTAPGWEQCMHDGAGDCPDDPLILMADKLNVGWLVTPMRGTPPNPNASSLEWLPLAELGMVFGSTGSGAWKGSIAWDE